MIIPKISKEEINVLSPVLFQGKITLIDDDGKLEKVIEKINTYSVIGFDTESKPSFSKGVYHKVSLVQVATEDHCFLFRLHKMSSTMFLFDLLANADICKIGLSLKDDFKRLHRYHRFTPKNVIDIQDIVKNYGIIDLGLQKIYAILFQQKISKSQRLTNWEDTELTEQQKRYAATDAWACLKIYQRLQQEKPLPSLFDTDHPQH